MPKSTRPANAGTNPRTGYGAVFAVREFRPVFAAHVLSMLGGVIAEVALSVLVFRLTGSTLLTALTFALGFLPYAVSGSLLSGVADRFPARRVLVVCDLVCAACAAAMVLPATPVAALFALRCVMAAVAPVFGGTRAGSLADILHGDAFVLGRSLIRIVSQGAQILGFGAGGLLLVLVEPRTALAVTAVTFLASALLLRFGTRPRPARTRTGGGGGGGGGMVRQSLAGSRQLLADRRVRALLALWWIPPMFQVVPEALAAPYAHGIGAGTAGLGLLMAAMPVGALLGEILAGGLLRPAVRARLTAPLALCALLPYAAFAVHPALPGALALMFATGLCSAYSLGVDQWFIAAVPDNLRGRAMTLLSAGLMTIQGLGMAVAGALAEFVPPHAVTAGAGVLGVACVSVVLRAVRRSAAAGGNAEPAVPVSVRGTERGTAGESRAGRRVS